MARYRAKNKCGSGRCATSGSAALRFARRWGAIKGRAQPKDSSNQIHQRRYKQQSQARVEQRKEPCPPFDNQRKQRCPDPATTLEATAATRSGANAGHGSRLSLRHTSTMNTATARPDNTQDNRTSRFIERHLPNVHANLPGPLQRLHAARSQNAATVKLSYSFALSLPTFRIRPSSGAVDRRPCPHARRGSS